MFPIKRSSVAFFLFFVGSLYAQPGFNKLVDAGYPRNDIWDMVIVNDTIIGYGFGFDDTINYNQALILTKFDSNGVLLNSAAIVDSLGDALNIGKTWGKIIPTSDGGFAMTAATVFRNSAFLIKTDSDFNVEFIKEYPDTVNLSNFHYKLFEIADGYMLYGTIQRPNFLSRPFVRKVDKQGNTVWFKFYGSENIADTFVGGGAYRDSLFIFGGVIAGSTIDLSSAQIYTVDSMGNVMETWNSGPHPEMGWLRLFKVLEDGNILIFGQYLIEVQNVIVQPTISLLRMDFSGFEWIYHYGRIDRADKFIQFWDMESLSNNEFIGAGQSRIEVNGEKEQSGWLMKFNTEGDSIWSRYDFPDFPIDSLGDTFFGGVGVLSSGSIIAGGTATLWNEQAIWLVKVTTDGCMEVINCGLVPTFSTPKPTEKLVLHLSPNPADAQVQVAWEAADINNAAIRLYDLQGHMVAQQKIQQGTQLAVFETGHLAAGIYFVEMRDGDGRFDRAKLLVLHH